MKAVPLICRSALLLLLPLQGTTAGNVTASNTILDQNSTSLIENLLPNVGGLLDVEEQQHGIVQNYTTGNYTGRNFSTGVVYAQEKYEEDDLIHEEQEALWRFFNESRLWASNKHDWFDSKYKLEGENYDYCQFTGIECITPDEDGLDGRRGVVVKIILRNKEMTGFLPDVFSDLPSLTTLHVASNQLRGPIPQSLGSLNKFRDLDFSNNLFTGGFPKLNSTAPVRRIMLQQNKLEGQLHPKSLCPFQDLKALDISGNEAMHGNIPNCVEDFEELDEFKFDGVGLTGEIPDALCDPDREMNGFNPNKDYGCDAIACPVGTYEPTLGRQQDKSTACRPCPNWPVDNPALHILGATACPEKSEHNTFQPTEPTTEGPTDVAIPTVGPSQAPEAPSGQDPHGALSAAPSEAGEPYNTTELVWNDERLFVQVGLADVHRALDGPEEVSEMESLTRKFLQTLLEEEDVVILKLLIASQQMITTAGFHESHVSEVKPPSRQLRCEYGLNPTKQPIHSPILIGNLRAGDSRSLETKAGMLMLDLDIIMTFLSTSDHTTKEVIASWDDNIDDYVALLTTSSLSSLFEEPIQDEGLHSEDSTTTSLPKWTLLKISLITSFLAVVSVALLAITRWYYSNRNRFYKRQHDDGPQRNSGSSLTSSLPHKSDLHETSSNPEDDVLRDVLDQRSTFSCWKHWDTLHGAVSEESDGGWNSGSGSGSVQDTFLRGSKNKSISNLLDPYIRDDVWSVAPDCLSSNNSVQSDGAVNTEDGLNDFIVPRRIQSADKVILIDSASGKETETGTACSF